MNTTDNEPENDYSFNLEAEFERVCNQRDAAIAALRKILAPARDLVLADEVSGPSYSPLREKLRAAIAAAEKGQ